MRPHTPAALAVTVLAGAAVLAFWRGGRLGASEARAAWDRTPIGVTSASIAYLERRHVARPDNYVLGNVLADRYLRRFRETGGLAFIRRAERLARESARRAPSASALARVAYTLLSQHRFAEALAETRRALALDSTNATANAIAFDALMEVGDFAGAERVLRRQDPGRFGTATREAKWQEALGNFVRADQEMERACAGALRGGVDAATIAWCYTERAMLATHLGQDAEAGRDLTLALEAFPGYRGALDALAWRAYRAGDLASARALYEQALANGAGPDLHVRLARLAELSGDTAAARAHVATFERVATAPGMEALYGRHLAVHLADTPGRTAGAVRLARIELARRASPESWGVLAWALYRNGDVRAAVGAARRSVAWGSPEATRLYHAGAIEIAVGERKRGEGLLVRALTRAYELDPADEADARRRLPSPR